MTTNNVSGQLTVAVVLIVSSVPLLLLYFIWRKSDKSLTEEVYSRESTHEGQSVVERKLDFMKRFGWTYGYSGSPSGHIDTWRGKEFPKLISPIELTISRSRKNKKSLIPTDINLEKEVYVDYAGAALPSQTQLKNVFSSITSGSMSLLGNPHSSNGGPASARASLLVEEAKKLVLDHFNCHPDFDYYYGFGKNHIGEGRNSCDPLYTQQGHPGYDIIFTSGATEALRILSASFPWTGDEKNANESTSVSCSQCTTSRTHNSKIRSSSVFLYPHNAHTSVIGMRNPVLAAGASFRCVKLDDIIAANDDQFYDWATTVSPITAQSADTLSKGHKVNEKTPQYCRCPKGDLVDADYSTIGCCDHKKKEISHLLAVSLECNFGGDIAPAQTIFHAIHQCNMRFGTMPTLSAGQLSAKNHRWYTILDVARAASHSPINLKKLNPDFACVSFYKMFGFPTGLGALFVKRSIDLHLLNRGLRLSRNAPKDESPIPHQPTYSPTVDSHTYFGGGSVDAILPHTDFVIPKQSLSSLVHGTVHFQGIASLSHGFAELSRVGGMTEISKHSRSLALEFVQRLKLLRHGNGQPAILIYGSWSKLPLEQFDKNNLDDSLPGPTVAFNIIRFDGTYVGYNEVSKLATLNNPPIQLRTGCFCNVGACQEALSISDKTFKENYFRMGHVCGDHNDLISGMPTGALRASFGKDNCWEDVDALSVFLQMLVINQNATCVGPEITGSVSLSDRSIEIGKVNRDRSWKMKELYVFPIKSCAPMRVKAWNIDRNTGKLDFDREFALVDADGVAMRLQLFPKMAKIYPFVDLNRRTLTVMSPERDDNLVLSLDDNFPSGTEENVNVCGNMCQGAIFGSQKSSEWFTSVLGTRCWLVRYVGKKCTPSNEIKNTGLEGAQDSSFSNEAPLLLISQQAVDILNGALQAQGYSLISPVHFRPNFVVEDGVELQTSSNTKYNNPEDEWSNIQIPSKNIEFSVLGKCARCSMVDIDPLTGLKSSKALNVLSKYRRERSSINFGIFLKTCTPTGTDITSRFCMLNEGDEILVIM